MPKANFLASPLTASQTELEQIEARLAVLFRQDKANWKEMAMLALRVQSQKLYRQRGLKSFSQWVKQTAEENDRSTSLIWRFLKAAKYFLLQIGSAELERVVEAIAAPEALEKLEKIERTAPLPVFLALKEKVLAGSATVSECRQIEKDYRPVASGRTNRGRPPLGHEGEGEYLGKWKPQTVATEDEQPTKQLALVIEDSFSATSAGVSNQTTPKQIASSMKRSLRCNPQWLSLCALSDSPPRNWETHKDVKVNTTNTRRDKQMSLRLGLLAVAQWDLNSKDLFIVEVTSRFQQLQPKPRWEQYLDFCNYFCFAYPQADTFLESVIQQRVMEIPSAGIITFDFSSATIGDSLNYPYSILKFPQRHKGKKTSFVYETLYERVMGWSVASE